MLEFNSNMSNTTLKVVNMTEIKKSSKPKKITQIRNEKDVIRYFIYQLTFFKAYIT